MHVFFPRFDVVFFLYLDPKPKRTIFIPIAQEVPQWTTKAQSSEHDARLVQAMSVDMNMTGGFFFFFLYLQRYNRITVICSRFVVVRTR